MLFCFVCFVDIVYYKAPTGNICVTFCRWRVQCDSRSLRTLDSTFILLIFFSSWKTSHHHNLNLQLPNLPVYSFRFSVILISFIKLLIRSIKKIYSLFKKKKNTKQLKTKNRENISWNNQSCCQSFATNFSVWKTLQRKMRGGSDDMTLWLQNAEMLLFSPLFYLLNRFHWNS